jgi:hypothetical protein
VAIHSLSIDVVAPSNMFDDELTYYADGTAVVMRAKGTERTGVAVGRADGGVGYDFQAVRWDDGGQDNVSPQVLHRR